MQIVAGNFCSSEIKLITIMYAKKLNNDIHRKIDKIRNSKAQDFLYDKLIKALRTVDNKVDPEIVTCFLSHTWASGQHYFAKYLTNRLNRYKKIQCWLDEENLNYGDHIYDKIDYQITYQTNIAIILLSPEYLLSHNCKVELSKANVMYAKKEIKLIPIVLAKAKIPLELEGLLFADFTDCLTKTNTIKRTEFEKKFKKLVSSILVET